MDYSSLVVRLGMAAKPWSQSQPDNQCTEGDILNENDPKESK